MREWTTKHIEDLVKKTIKGMDIGSRDEYLRSVFYDIRNGNCNVVVHKRKKGEIYGKYYFYINDVLTYSKINTLAEISIKNVDYYILAAFPYVHYIDDERAETSSSFFYWEEATTHGDAIMQTNIFGTNVTIPKDDLVCRSLTSDDNLSISFHPRYNSDNVTLNGVNIAINVLLIKKSSSVVNETLFSLSLPLN